MLPSSQCIDELIFCRLFSIVLILAVIGWRHCNSLDRSTKGKKKHICEPHHIHVLSSFPRFRFWISYLSNCEALGWISLPPFSIPFSPALWVAGVAGVGPSCLRVMADTLIWLTGFRSYALKVKQKEKYERKIVRSMWWCTVCVIAVCAVSSSLLVSWWVTQHTWGPCVISRLSPLQSFAVSAALWRYAGVFGAIMLLCVILLLLLHVIQHLQPSTPHCTHAHFNLCPSKASVTASPTLVHMGPNGACFLGVKGRLQSGHYVTATHRDKQPSALTFTLMDRR